MKADIPSANIYMAAELIWSKVDPATDFFESRALRTVAPVGKVDAEVSVAVVVELVVEDSKVVGAVPESSEFWVSPSEEAEEADEAPEDESEGSEADDPTLLGTGVASTNLGMAIDPT